MSSLSPERIALIRSRCEALGIELVSRPRNIEQRERSIDSTPPISRPPTRQRPYTRKLYVQSSPSTNRGIKLDRNQIKSLLLQGASYSAIARVLNSDHSAIRYVALQLGIKATSTGCNRSRHKEVVALIHSGITDPSTICQQLKCSASVVSQVKRRLACNPQYQAT